MKGSPKGGAEENTFIKAYEELEKSGKTPLRGPEAFPLLEIVHGPKQGAWFTVAYQKEITLGRAATNSIVLEDNSVSRSHAVLQMSGEGFTVRDIGSRNGTFLNQKKVQGEMLVKHLDVIKVGIYTLRFLEEVTEEAFELEAREEHTPRVAESIVADEHHTDFSAAAEEEAPAPVMEAPPPQKPKKKADDKTINEDLNQIIGQDAGAQVAARKGSRAVRNLLILSLILAVLGGGAYVAYRFGAFQKLKAYLGGAKTTIAKNEKKETPPAQLPAKVIVPEKNPETPPGLAMPVFIESDAKPVAAKVFYKGKELGITPFKVSIQVPPGQPQELVGEFFLDGIGEKWTEKTTFQASKQDEVIPVNFQAKLGKLNVTALPKDGQLYMEGRFDPGQTAYKPLKIANVAFDTPIYLPYGKYVAEVRQTQALGDSTSTVNAIKYRREFEIGPNSPEFTVSASDETVKSFPAKIKSEPPGADLLVDGKKLGQTPFDGNLPTGRHKLVLRKEGFNDFEKEINIELNTPYEANYNLATSPAGEFINKGRALLKKGQYNEAIENLAESLKRSPEPTELAQIHLLLGDAFIQTKTFDQALAYYQRAKESPEYSNQAELGIAAAHSGLGQNDQALIRIINVVVNTKDTKTQSEAESLYHKIYPMKSVLYVATQPPGASISVNGNPIAQVTPVILSDLLVGSYRVKIEKQGFKAHETRVTVPLSAIKSVIVTLQPDV